MPLIVVGLDVAGVETRATGFCTLNNMKAETLIVHADDEILKRTRAISPQVVAIDAPLSLPPGRQSIDQITNVHLRECGRELLRRGIRFFPTTLGPMRKLTVRGMNLKRTLQNENFMVIEVPPWWDTGLVGHCEETA